MQRLDPIITAVAVFLLSAIAGLATLLRSSRELTCRTICSAILNAGIIGTAIFLCLFQQFESNPLGLLGGCLFAGLGGMTVISLVLYFTRQGGVQILICSPRKKKKDVEDKET